MARPKLPILTRITNGLRDDTIDPMAIEDPRCWLWQGSLHTDGYPRLRDSQPPHRRLFELLIRTDPKLWDYELPTFDPKDTLYHTNYPKLGDERSRTTNKVHSTNTCGQQTCINPYHYTWEGVRYGKPENWGYFIDDKPEDLREKVPPLPSLDVVVLVSTLPAKMAEWFREGPADLSFDELFAEAQMDFYEYPVDEIHAALTEVLKCPKA